MAQRNMKVVITGGSAGMGRATADVFASRGHDVALIARDAARLERAAQEITECYGVRALALPADVADSEAVDLAAQTTLLEFGRLDVWVNVAMATAFAPVALLKARDVERGTQVTYLGQVNGMLAALRCMRAAGQGTIVNVGSALSYRSVPLQSVYCGAKFAIRGFTDALRSELLHDGLDIHLTMVDLPAINTPQFDWAMNLMGRARRGRSHPYSSPKSPRVRSILLPRTGGGRSGSADPRSRRYSPTVLRPPCSTAISPARDIVAN